MDYYFKPNESIKDYSIIRKIGEGRYGIVYLAENKYLEKFIIKQLKLDMLEETKEKLFYEQELLQSLYSPHLPLFIESFEAHSTFFYVLEYISGHVIDDLIFQVGYQFNRREIYKIASQLLEILDFLHKNNILHRDIRPPNVILKPNKELVLIDFGLARYINSSRYIKPVDFWYLGDFLLHLYYTSYHLPYEAEEKPWHEELDLTSSEKTFLKKLMGIDSPFEDVSAVKEMLGSLRTQLNS